MILISSSWLGLRKWERSPSLHNEVHQQLVRCRNRRPGQSHVLVGSVGRLAVSDNTKSSHQLLKWMRLQLARDIDPLLKKGLVLDRHVDTPEHSARDSEPRLEVPLVIDGRKTTDTKEVP